MRTSVKLGAAMALASTMLTFAGRFSPADARIALSDCISAEWACHKKCLLELNGMPATLETVYGVLVPCLNQCDGNHAACVDFFFNQARINPSSPPQGPGPTGGLLDNNPGFSPQGPAATGTPVAPSTPPPVLK